jgi:acyl carrier protein
MTPEPIQERLTHEIASILSVEPATIRPNTPLGELGLDSMGFVEVLVFIEKTFNLKLIESGLTREDFGSIQSLARRIVRELEK